MPIELQASFLLWFTAVAAGVLETIIRTIDALLVGSASGSGGEADLIGSISNVVIRVIVYTLVVYIIRYLACRMLVGVLLTGWHQKDM